MRPTRPRVGVKWETNERQMETSEGNHANQTHFFSVQRLMALARSLSKPESQLHISKFSELMQWQHPHIDNVHQK